ncbi:MAG: ABC transporter substrate-binding protein [Devosia sp.]|uniref:ABC transporter substrate-binding protein n=1 Tax=Devosia sp. TaxID=1871048 RepID=UPI0024C5F629|nr:ABC transporter substrate-binding protein [Devosia sp.]UYN99406.1 MAG: ABC transporter substrate-binding protein [Devosia sp.]
MMKVLFALATIAAIGAVPVVAQESCEAGFRLFEHGGGQTCIPEKAERIVGLHDQSITLTLLEIGAPVVGSHGRVADDGREFLRSVEEMLGYTFENSGIGFVGSYPLDVEAIAALSPDLIIARTYDLDLRQQYEVIAPTVFIADDPQDPMNFARDVADASGELEEWERLLEAYQRNIETARRTFPELVGQSYAKIQAWDGKLTVYAGYGGLTKVLEDLGLVRTPFAQAMSDRGVAWGEEVSVELLPEQQADYTFDTYNIAGGDTYGAARQRLVDVLPNWCDVLKSCSEGRYIVLPREYSTGYGFSQLNTLIPLITTHAARVPVGD